MSKVEESTLTVSLDAQGRDISNMVKEWSIDTGYLTSCDGFEFSLYSDDISQTRGLELQPITMSVAGANQLVGRIDASNMGGDGLAIRYRGRDYISDMVECRCDPTATVKEGLDLAGAITTVAGVVGIDTVIGDGDVPLRNVRTGKSIVSGAGPDFRSFKASDVKPDYGQGIYDFLNRLVVRHGATIQPSTSRNEVILTSPNYQQNPTYKLRRRIGQNAAGNNIVRATASRDFSSVPSFTMYNGNQTRVAKQTIPASQLFGVGYDVASDTAKSFATVLAATTPGAGAGVAANLIFPGEGSVTKAGFDGTKKYDTANAFAGFAPNAADIMLGACHIGRRKPADGTGDPLKLYRLLAIRDNESRNQAQLERAAVRAFAERLKDTLVYEVEVQGHIDPESGAVWSVDTIVDVVDEVCDISEPLWIASRTLSYSKKSGAMTKLKCWRPGAFVT